MPNKSSKLQEELENSRTTIEESEKEVKFFFINFLNDQKYFIIRKPGNK
jgi:hypothetical protein